MRLEYLTIKDYEDWQFGKDEYLEKVCKINLKKLSLINRMIRKHSSELKLEKSWTGYNQHGKGENQRLIFSKTGNKDIEEAYATHYVNKQIIKELKKE